MFIKMKTIALLGALAAGGLVTLGAPTPAKAQFGPGFGYGPGIGPVGGFGGINLSIGFGKGPGIGHGCRHGCRVPCGHGRPFPVVAPLPLPGCGYGGGSFYREYRSGYIGGPGFRGFPGYGGYRGYCW